MPDEPSEQSGRSIANELSQDMMRAMAGMPAALEAMVEGRDVPVDIPEDQFAEAQQRAFWILVRYVQSMAFEIDRLRFKFDLDQEPGPFGPPDQADPRG